MAKEIERERLKLLSNFVFKLAKLYKGIIQLLSLKMRFFFFFKNIDLVKYSKIILPFVVLLKTQIFLIYIIVLNFSQYFLRFEHICQIKDWPARLLFRHVVILILNINIIQFCYYFM